MNRLNLGFTGQDFYRALNPVNKQKSIMGFAFGQAFPIVPIAPPVNQVTGEKKSSKANGAINKGLYLKALINTKGLAQAKLDFLAMYTDPVFGVKRLRIYLNDINKGRY